jgi:low affinity Fe/Cu permease
VAGRTVEVNYMSDSSSKFTKILGSIASPWTLVIAVLLLSAWALTEGYLDLPKIGKLVINFSLATLTLFIVWRIQRKQAREVKAIRMKIAALTRYIKSV